MGLLEQFLDQPFQRKVTSFEKDPIVLFASGSPKQEMGSSYIILNARLTEGTAPVRLRLYANQASRDIDVNRPAGNFNLSESVALAADIVLTNSSTFTFDPPVIGVTYDGNVYWHLSGSGTKTTVEVTTYPIEESGGSNEYRTSLVISGSSVTSGSYATRGTLSSSKSFLILTGSATTGSRLRLYSRPISEVAVSEISRSFNVQTGTGSLLIADLLFDSASFKYPLVPVLESYTWEQNNYSVGSGLVGYILENITPTPVDITASLYLYKTEE